jgi:peptidoglycan/LPS O-acetylase OafA/YrhL
MHKTRRSRPRPNVERISTRNAGVRWDIQGLRAFAVLAVVADHLFDYPRGGFVGVDVFFVISGFLISSHLVRQAESTGIRWVEFYRKRIKRILPAAVLVLIVTTIASYIALSPARADSVRTDSVWALLFGANFRMLDLNTDYFNATGTSPVQHYWSLSIEEQFYFVWPILLLALYFVLRRTAPHHLRLAAGGVMGLIVAASFTWAVLETNNNPSAAYFNTAARFWELGVGALLAVSVPLLQRIPDALRTGLAWLGLAGATASLWLVDEAQGFPAPWAALPVVCTALVIAAGTYGDRERQQRYLFPLTNRASNYVGDVSYSLYLWHFPIIVIGTATWGESTSVKLALLVAMFVVSYFAYALVEDPIRNSGWLTSTSKSKRGSRSLAGVSRRYQLTAFSCLAVVAVTMSVFALQPPEKQVSALDSIDQGEIEEGPVEALPPLLTVHQANIERALADTSWPEDLTTSMDDVVGARQSPVDISECSGKMKGPKNASDCAWGPENAKSTAVLVGDSEALAYSSPLRTATLDKGWRFLSRVATACPFVDLKVNEGLGNFNPYCEDIKAAAIRDIKATKPDVLFVVNFPWGAPDYPAAEYIAASDRQLAKVADSVKKIVYVAAPPPAKNPAECFKPGSAPADCTGAPTEVWEAMNRTQRTLADAHGGVWVQSERWYCWQRLCPPYIDKTPVRGDGEHITLEFADKLEPVMAESLDQAGVFAGSSPPA